MSVDVLQHLAAGENLRGAVFLTYTLNLNFFEQLVTPRLDRAGCSSVLVLVDRYGYDSALGHESRNLSGVGTRYVCAPLVSPGRGVQHAKLALMVGRHGGRLLIGSGNLTFHGFCRNLELFNSFEIEVQNDEPPPPEAAYLFVTAWRLISGFRQRGNLSSAAEERLDAIHEVAPWLTTPVEEPHEFRVWDNFAQSLFNRLAGLGPVDELQIISPFIALDTVGALIRRLQPRRLVVGVDMLSPNFDGASLAARCEQWECDLELRALGGSNSARTLHAKAVIGVSKHGSWCMSGSANCTPPALLHTWSASGNLELAIWRRSPDPDAFRDVWLDGQIAVSSLDPGAVHAITPPAVDSDADEARAPVRLLELSIREGVLQGRYEQYEALPDDALWHLELLRQRESFPIRPDDARRFAIALGGSLKGSEAARIVLSNTDGIVAYSAYHWIDQPEELARYGRRSYYARVKMELSTFDGAGRLFEELLNFLWERVDPVAMMEADKGDKSSHPRYRGREGKGPDAGRGELPPPPSAFITDEEFTESIGWRVAQYIPYDRSILSLRDLLSLTLLKLTAETEPDSSDVGDAQERDEDEDARREVEREIKLRDILIRLRKYLVGYSRRYAKRLVDPSFVQAIGPALLFENHYTLGRVLLEFADKTDREIFTSSALQACVVSMCGGLFWPKCAGLDGRSAWHTLRHFFNSTDIKRAWNQNNLSALIVALMSESWREIPGWKELLYDRDLAQEFMLARSMINRLEECLGSHWWGVLEAQPIEAHKLRGFRQVTDLYDSGEELEAFDDALVRFKQLASYRSPVEEKYSSLFKWWELRRRHEEHSPEAKRLLSEVRLQGYAKELELFRYLPPDAEIVGLEGNGQYCPRCGIQLTIRDLNDLQRGGLVVCPDCRRVVVYWRPEVLY